MERRVEDDTRDGKGKMLEDLRRLLILLLLKSGASPDEIGHALRVTGRRVQQMFPTASVKRGSN